MTRQISHDHIILTNVLRSILRDHEQADFNQTDWRQLIDVAAPDFAHELAATEERVAALENAARRS